MDHKPKKSNSSKKEQDREQKRITEIIQNRRALHTTLLEGPEYTIRPEILLKDGGYCEKEIRVKLLHFMILLCWYGLSLL